MDRTTRTGAFVFLSVVYWLPALWIVVVQVAGDCPGACPPRHPLRVLGIEVAIYSGFASLWWFKSLWRRLGSE